MDELTRAGFLGHAQSRPFRRRVLATIEVLLAHLDARSYVSFSAGKDSSVVADLCHRHRQGVPMLMVDPGCPTHWLEEERSTWIDFAARRGWNLRLFPWNKWAAVAGAADEQDHRRRAHAGMFADLHAHAALHGLDQRITGLRGAESPQRRMLTAQRGVAYRLADGSRALNPIAHWSTADVWAWIVTHDLPWLTIYDHLGPAARNGLIGRSGARSGRLAWLKIHYPEAWATARDLMPMEADQYG